MRYKDHVEITKGIYARWTEDARRLEIRADRAEARVGDLLDECARLVIERDQAHRLAAALYDEVEHLGGDAEAVYRLVIPSDAPGGTQEREVGQPASGQEVGTERAGETAASSPGAVVIGAGESRPDYGDPDGPLYPPQPNPASSYTSQIGSNRVTQQQQHVTHSYYWFKDRVGGGWWKSDCGRFACFQKFSDPPDVPSRVTCKKCLQVAPGHPERVRPKRKTGA